MAFHNVRFPDNVDWGSSGGPAFNTLITVLDSGAEQRVGRYNQPRRTFRVGYQIKSRTDIKTVIDFFNARQGSLHSFRYKDWTSFATTATGRTGTALDTTPVASTDVQIGTGDGSTTDFQLITKSTSGAITRNRNITKPVSGTVAVALAGVTQVSGYTVNHSTGIVTFTPAPGVGVAVTAGFQFDCHVRFSENTDKGLSVQLAGFESEQIDNLELVEVLDEATVADEFFMGGSLDLSLSGNYVLDMASARCFTISMTTTGLAVACQDPTNLPWGGPYYYLVNGGSNAFAVKDHLGNTIKASLTAGNGMQLWLRRDNASSKIWVGMG